MNMQRRRTLIGLGIALFCFIAGEIMKRVDNDPTGAAVLAAVAAAAFGYVVGIGMTDTPPPPPPAPVKKKARKKPAKKKAAS